MLANRRAVRPDGQYYRQTRRQRMSRSFARGGGGAGAMLLILLLLAGLLAFWGAHGGLWPRLLGFGGAAILLLSALAMLISGKR